MEDKAAMWRRHRQAWDGSGLSAAAYCREQGLSYAQWTYWQRRLGAASLLPITLPAPQARRTTLAEWIGVIGLRLQPLVDALTAQLLQARVLHADETPIAQLDPGAGKTRRAYLFAYRSMGAAPSWCSTTAKAAPASTPPPPSRAIGPRPRCRGSGRIRLPVVAPGIFGQKEKPRRLLCGVLV